MRGGDKDVIITYLEKHSQTAVEPVTRLYFTINGKQDFIEDYTYFANETYMSKELLAALSSGKTLSKELQQELDSFRIESILH